MPVIELEPWQTWGERLYEGMTPVAYADAQHGEALRHFLDTLGVAHQPLEEVIADTENGPGWAIVFDVDTCPSWGLPWLAQLVGVQLPIGISVEEARDRIRTPSGFARGTVLATVAAAQRRLSGTRKVVVLERVEGHAYRYTVVTRDTETPETDWRERTNLIPNPSAEGGAETTKVTTTVASATLNAFSASDFNVEVGYRAFFMEATSSGASGTALMLWQGSLSAPNANRIPVEEGVEYTLSAVGCYIADKPTNGQRFYIAWYNAAGTQVGATVAGNPVTATGEQIPPEFVATAPAGAVAAAVAFGNIANIASPQKSTFWIDALMFTAEPGEYFDGRTPGYRWTGTPYQSPSERVLTSIVHRELLAEKPVGLKLTYVISNGPIIDELEGTIDDQTGTVDDYLTA